MKTFFDRWPWEPEMLAWTTRLALTLGPALALVLLPFHGLAALGGLCVTPFVLLFRVVHGVVGRRVAALVPVNYGHAVSALMVNGKIQAPGLASIDDTKIVLHPIIGERVEIPLDGIESNTVTSAFNGKAIPGKRAFWFQVKGGKRLGVAVSNLHAERWRTLTPR